MLSNKKRRPTNKRRKTQRTKNTRKYRLKKPIHKKHAKKPIAYGHVFSTECGHCINMQGDWDKLKKEVGNDIELLDISNNHQEQVNSVNASFQTDLKFSGFPTIFKIKHKKAPTEYYQGERTFEFMEKWLYS